MNTLNKNQPGLHIDQEVDLLLYIAILLRHKYKIIICAVLGALLAFSASLLLDNTYGASATVAININEEPGGVDPKGYRSSNTLGLLEHDFIIEAANAHENEKFRMIASISSFAFNMRFIEEENLLPYLFKDHWDESNQSWKDDFVPDKRVANKLFLSLRSVDIDDVTGLMKVSFTTTNGELSARLTNNLVSSFNKYTREIQSRLIKERTDFLNKRLTEIDNIELHRSIFRMIETQLAAESFLQARKNYPLEIIEPAMIPLFKQGPKRKQITALTFIALFLLGVITAIASIILKNIREGLKAYQGSTDEEANRQLEELRNKSNIERIKDDWEDS